MPHRPHPPHVRARLLARVATGELIADICAAPGAPSVGAVSYWARRDPAFATALEAAKQSGRHVRRRRFDPAKAQRLLARLAAGETITAALSDPAMPSRAAYAHWRATEPAFAAEIARINGRKREARNARCRARFRPFDPALADRLLVRVLQGGYVREVLAGDPELPSQGVLARWRREVPAFAAELQVAIAAARTIRRRQCPEDLLEDIWERMLFGDTLARLGLRRDMPCRTTLYAWIKARPDFRLAVAQALMARHDLLYDEAYDVAVRNPVPSREARRTVENLIAKAERVAAKLIRLDLVEEIAP